MTEKEKKNGGELAGWGLGAVAAVTEVLSPAGFWLCGRAVV